MLYISQQEKEHFLNLRKMKSKYQIQEYLREHQNDEEFKQCIYKWIRQRFWKREMTFIEGHFIYSRIPYEYSMIYIDYLNSKKNS